MGHDPDNPGVPVPDRRPVGFESPAPLGVEQLDATRWRTTHDLVFHYLDPATGEMTTVLVPAGYVTDFATSPACVRGVVPKSGRHNPATIVHDHLCEEALAGRFRRRDADAVFHAALRDLDVLSYQRGAGRGSTLLRWIMWAAVRWGGLTSRTEHAVTDFGRDLPRVLPLTVIALPVAGPVAVVTQAALLLIAAIKGVEVLLRRAVGGPRQRRHNP
ncbi:MAG: DUF1353 domain-containing protein [Pseudonocardiaceae bacterium]